MDTMWILIADQSRARFFAIDGESRRPREIEDRVNPEGRAHERDLVTDGPGRYFGKGERDHAHTSAPRVLPTEHEADRFAKALTDHLDKARAQNLYTALQIVAPPKFLGRLRHFMSDEVTKRIVAEIDKDVSWYEPRALEEFLQEHAKRPGLTPKSRAR